MQNICLGLGWWQAGQGGALLAAQRSQVSFVGESVLAGNRAVSLRT